MHVEGFGQPASGAGQRPATVFFISKEFFLCVVKKGGVEKFAAGSLPMKMAIAESEGTSQPETVNIASNNLLEAQYDMLKSR